MVVSNICALLRSEALHCIAAAEGDERAGPGPTRPERYDRGSRLFEMHPLVAEPADHAVLVAVQRPRDAADLELP